MAEPIITPDNSLNRRDFLKTSGLASGGVVNQRRPARLQLAGA